LLVFITAVSFLSPKIMSATDTDAAPIPSLHVSQWPHRPAYFCAHPDVDTKDFEKGAPLPLGRLVEFETDLFVGRMLFRLKPIPPTEVVSNECDADEKNQKVVEKAQEDYFEGKKRNYQFVIQGRFRKEIPISNLVIGDFYTKPMVGIPKGIMMRMYQRFMETINPGVIMDMTSDTPKALGPFGSAQTLRVDIPGQEPDLSQTTAINNLKDNTKLLFENPIVKKKGFNDIEMSTSKRRSWLSNPKNSCNHSTNPEHVYTVELYDHTMCFGSYNQHAMGMKIDMTKTMNGQPLSIGIFTYDDQKIVCKFPIWHERLLAEMKAAKSEGKK